MGALHDAERRLRDPHRLRVYQEDRKGPRTSIKMHLQDKHTLSLCCFIFRHCPLFLPGYPLLESITSSLLLASLCICVCVYVCVHVTRVAHLIYSYVVDCCGQVISRVLERHHLFFVFFCVFLLPSFLGIAFLSLYLFCPRMQASFSCLMLPFKKNFKGRILPIKKVI